MNSKLSKTSKITCPQCNQSDTWKPENTFRPFCSERCKLIDLGDWAAEKHRVPGEPVPQASDEEDQL